MNVLPATWPAPATIKAFTTLRNGGVSDGAYHSWNLATHVGDSEIAVKGNRALLRKKLQLPDEPCWLNQIHGTTIVDAAQISQPVNADGAITDKTGVVCVVLTADCLPLFLCDQHGRKVGLLHVGWRGLAAGIVLRGIAAMNTPAEQLLAWLGPAISQKAFEVGVEVKDQLLQAVPGCDSAFLTAKTQGKYLADLYALCRVQLSQSGVNATYGGDQCTFSQPDDYFSFRRESQCGRMASVIWISPSSA